MSRSSEGWVLRMIGGSGTRSMDVFVFTALYTVFPFSRFTAVPPKMCSARRRSSRVALLFFKRLSLIVENNGCLAVKPKSIKLTYAETVRVKKTVEAQNRLISNGGDPSNQ